MTARWTELRRALLALTLPESVREEIVAATSTPPPNTTIEERSFDQSYIQFLDQQIENGARGHEWTEMLRRRATALRPFVGETLSCVTVARPSVYFTARFLVQDGTLKVVHVETIGSEPFDSPNSEPPRRK